MTSRQQNATGKQGYAETIAKHKINFMIIVFAGYIAASLIFYLYFYFVQHQLSFVYVAICLFFVIFHLTHTKQKWIPLILLISLIYISLRYLLKQVHLY